MPILTITDDSGDIELVKLHIGAIEPQNATVAIIQALAAIKKPRKPRSDAGKSRKPKET